MQPTSGPATTWEAWHHLTPAEGLQFVMARVGRRLRSAWRTDPAAVGVLHELAKSGPMRITALAEVLVLDISTTSRHVSGLESSGYVFRKSDPSDRRATLLELSPAGRRFLANALAERSAVLRAATSSWSDDDINALHTYLNRLADDLGDLPNGDDAP
jgi:DNA-binding MarR family transcriptional regulator